MRSPHWAAASAFQIPAVGFFAHVQTAERLAGDGAKRPHVGVRHAVEEAEKNARKPTGEDLEISMLPGSRRPRMREPITKSQSPATIGCSSCPISEGTSLPSPSMKTRYGASSAAAAPAHMPGHIRASARPPLWRRPPCLGGGRICAAVVDHDALADQVPRNFADYSCDILRLVQCGNDSETPPNQRLQRKPQLEQAGGGCGLSKARRNSWYFCRSRSLAWSLGSVAQGELS